MSIDEKFKEKTEHSKIECKDNTEPHKNNDIIETNSANGGLDISHNTTSSPVLASTTKSTVQDSALKKSAVNLLNYIKPNQENDCIQNALDNKEMNIKDSLFIANYREIIEKAVEFYYFNVTPKNELTYIQNLIKINPLLHIEDLIYEKLAELHKLVEINDNISVIRQLKRFSLLFRTKLFSRSMLLHTFENIVYSDFNLDPIALYLKYNILNQIIKQYSRIDNRIKEYTLRKEISTLLLDENTAKEQIKYIKDSLSQLKDLPDANEIKQNILTELDRIDKNIKKTSNKEVDNTLARYGCDIFLNDDVVDISVFCTPDKVDLSKDNVHVLANIIWENTFYIISNPKVYSNINLRLYENSDCNLLDFSELPTINNKDSCEFELNCILLLYTSVVSETGRFLENRIMQNIGFLEKVCLLPAFPNFCCVLGENFENKKKIFSIVEPLLKKRQT